MLEQINKYLNWKLFFDSIGIELIGRFPYRILNYFLGRMCQLLLYLLWGVNRYEKLYLKNSAIQSLRKL